MKTPRTVWIVCIKALFMSAVLATAASQVYADSIVNSKHNLSLSGPGPVKALSESRICIFCHTPHNASPVSFLWNRDENFVSYDSYESSTLNASVGQPSGASKLCLSCHDGTVALGLVRSEPEPIDFSGGVTVMPEGEGLVGTDLRDDHPISFSYDGLLLIQNPELADPGTLGGSVRLDGNRQLQCTSCHDPHDNQFGKFLVTDNAYSALCTTCHKKTNWSSSSHATSSRFWNGVPPDPWPHSDYNQVDLNGCENCHRPHSAGHPARLLNAVAEEANCLPCHNGNVAQANIETELLKLTSHPVGSTTGAHDPTENTLTATRHVECTDCHNPHRAASGNSSAPFVTGPLQGVSGIDSSGSPVSQAQYQYEICFKCHADGSNIPAPTIPRQIPEPNLRLRFNPSNASYHPVEATGKNPSVPSLLSPYTTSSVIYCTACHNNNNGPGAGGIGPSGPHGSINEFLLERNLDTRDRSRESPQTYALCYKCHDRQSILNNESFKRHKKHVEEEDAPCTVCHDPHGTSANTHLINFDISVVTPSKASGLLKFEDLGDRRGRCYLTCHGEDHDPEEYKP